MLVLHLPSHPCDQLWEQDASETSKRQINPPNCPAHSSNMMPARSLRLQDENPPVCVRKTLNFDPLLTVSWVPPHQEEIPEEAGRWTSELLWTDGGTVMKLQWCLTPHWKIIERKHTSLTSDLWESACYVTRSGPGLMSELVGGIKREPQCVGNGFPVNKAQRVWMKLGGERTGGAGASGCFHVKQLALSLPVQAGNLLLPVGPVAPSFLTAV